MEEKLKVYWFGYGGSSNLAEELRPSIESLDMTLTTIHEHANANVKWELDTWLDEIKKADIIILPTNYKEQPSKSNNRLTQSLSLGIPVICSPMDSYIRVEKETPGCCLFADHVKQWWEQLRHLKNNPDIRRELSEKALLAASKYSLKAMGSKWLETLQLTNKVDIVIPTYNNPRCLKLCIESIRNCTNYIYNIIVVNNGSDEETKNYLDNQSDVTHIKHDRLSFSQAINIGVYSGSSEYVCLLNDDTIVSKGWLRKMIESCTDGVGAVGPLSNCDKGWQHNYDLNVAGVELLAGRNTPDQIEPIIPNIYSYDPKLACINGRDWVAFYCTLIPRSVIRAVGKLDEGFVNSGEDVDYCRRIRKMGYSIIQNYDSFVFHFGAVGRKILESEDKEAYQRADHKTNQYLNEKWNRDNVVIYTGPSWERWDFRNVDKGGIGGSETWAVYMSREFSKAGYRVKVFADCPESGIKDGAIEYLHFSKYPEYIEQNWIDCFISSRTTDTLKFPVRAGKTYVMIHDIWLLSPKEQIFLDKVDKFCVLSEWHKGFVRDYHKIPEDKLWITSNGLDFDKFDKCREGVERNPYRMMYSSSPDRGLDTLLYLFDFIKSQVPEAELHIFYGFENWEKSVRSKNNPHELEKMKKIKKAMEKDGVVYHGRIGQADLYKEWFKTALWAYPSDFEETFCITGLEAQRAGVPVIATNYAGLRTTVANSGILVGSGLKGASYQKQFRKDFVDRCVSLLTDNMQWKAWSELGLKNTERFSWETVARNWIKSFKNDLTC